MPRSTTNSCSTDAGNAAATAETATEASASAGEADDGHANAHEPVHAGSEYAKSS